MCCALMSPTCQAALWWEENLSIEAAVEEFDSYKHILQGKSTSAEDDAFGKMLANAIFTGC